MSQIARMLLFGALGLGAGMLMWYFALHPPMEYQREKLNHATQSGLRRRNVAIAVAVVFLTLLGAILGWVLPSN